MRAKGFKEHPLPLGAYSAFELQKLMTRVKQLSQGRG